MTSPTRRILRNGREHAEYGCTVTFKRADGSTFSGHRTGPVFDALRDLCDEAAAIDPSARVISISTPQTIFEDLRGRAIDHGRARLGEGQLLRTAGRGAMLHPTLAARKEERWGR